MILAGDIGGTNTRLMLVRRGGSPLAPDRVERFRNREHAGLGAIARGFLDRHAGGTAPEAAVFGIAGPVLGERVEATNVAWTIDAAELRRELGIGTVLLCNDLETTGHGLAVLPADRFHVLQEGLGDPRGNGALIAAGTGLGESILAREADGGFRPLASEGGHSDFAPRTEEQDELLRFLRRRFRVVAWEHALSGPGLARIHAFLLERGAPPEAPALALQLAGPDAPRAISEAALAGTSETCAAALRLFSSLYGAEAANLALKAMATGGVFVGGGIAPRILPFLDAGAFLASFRDNPPLAEVLARMPVRIVLDEDTSLLGAAALALSRCGRS